jgi:hypothetical protein
VYVNDAPSFSFGPKILRNMRKCVNLKSKLIFGELYGTFSILPCAWFERLNLP